MGTPGGAGLQNVAGNAARRATSLRRYGGWSHAVPFRTSLATTMHARRIGGEAERRVPLSKVPQHKLSFEGCGAVRIAAHPSAASRPRRGRAVGHRVSAVHFTSLV